MTDQLLKAVGVSKAFGAHQALHEASLDLRRGEVHALLGANGAGKSTLAWLFAGRFSDYSGRIDVAGREVQLRSRRQALELGIHIVSQEPSLAPNLTVTESLSLGGSNTSLRFGRRAMAEREELKQGLFEISGAEFDLDAMVGRLPLALRQTLDFARAMRSQPKVLILDEPALSSATSRRAIETAIAGRATTGVAFLVISHNVGDVLKWSDRATILRDGQTTETVAASSLDQQSVASALRAGPLKVNVQPSKRGPSEPDGKSLTLSLRRNDARTQSVTFGENRVTGLVTRPSEAASAMFRDAVGLSTRPEGRATLKLDTGRPLTIKDQTAAVFYLSPDREIEAVFPNLSAATNVTLLSPESFNRVGVLLPKRMQQMAKDATIASGFDQTRLEDRAEQLSGGNQQKLLVARASLSSAAVVVLDEPNRGVDVSSLPELASQVRSLARRGRWVIVLSSDTDFMSLAADEVVEVDTTAEPAS